MQLIFVLDGSGYDLRLEIKIGYIGIEYEVILNLRHESIS